MADIPITPGSGGSSVATELVGARNFQQIEVVSRGGASVLGVNPDGSINASIVGTPTVTMGSGSVLVAQKGAWTTSVAVQSTDFYPMYNTNALGGGPIRTDPVGALEIHGGVLTDEGTARSNFTGSSLKQSLGTATFTNGSITVTGSGFASLELHFLDYVKLSADSETSWAQVNLVLSDTQLQLVSPYTGTSATGAGDISTVSTLTGSGATISVASGQLTMATGTTASVTTAVYRVANQPPLNAMLWTSRFAISQRIVNQEIYCGLESAVTSPIKYFARFHFTGTTNTQVITETGFNPTTDPSTSEIESNTITLPGGTNTASANNYRIDCAHDTVTFYINNVIVAQHSARIPHISSASLAASLRSTQAATVTNTNLVVDYTFTHNYDRLDTFSYNPISPSVWGIVGSSIIGQLPAGTAFIGNVGVSSGSIATIPTGNQSVSGTVGASIIGTVPVTVATLPNGSVSGTVGASIIGAVPANIQGSVATVIIGGSIAASFTPPANQSVSGTVQTDVRGSVAVAIISGSIAATFTPPANQSVSGTVGASIIGLAPFIIGGSTNASVITVGGSAPANQSVSGAINVSGSVLLGSSNASVISLLQTSSIIAINAGSVIAIPSGSVITVLQAPSIVGTFAEDSAHTSGDKGIFSLNVRNDTLASVTSNDGDYGAMSLGPVGEAIFANSPITKWVSGTASMLGGVPLQTSVTVIAAQGASIFTYITGVQVANLGSASVLVSFGGATSSIIGYTIAPAGGGSNITFPNALKTSANAAFSASVSGTASIYVAAQGFISKT